jgi:hypothetical protein
MNARHAAALALVGWYLMLPPTQEALDSNCGLGDTWTAFRVYKDILSLVAPNAAERAETANIEQCDREGIVIANDAPLSRWNQGGEFETLAACEAERQKPLTEKEKAVANFVSGFTRGSGVSKDDLIRSQETAVNIAKCIASDDPRLKGD